MPRKLSLIAAAFILAEIVCSPGRAQDTPSLGDIARQAQKDKANKPMAKVITNDDMPSASGSLSSALGVAPGPAAPSSATGKPDTAQSPEAGLQRLQSILDRLDTLDRATLVNNVLHGNNANFPGRAKWEEKLFAAKQTFVAQSRDLLEKARQLEATAEGMKDVKDPNDPRAKNIMAQLQQFIRESQQATASFEAIIEEGKDLSAQNDTHER